MEKSAMEAISERLSAIKELNFPTKILIQNPDSSKRKSALFDLISRDASIFLERYGPILTLTELNSFDVISSDYEIKHHIDRLRRNLLNSPAKSVTLRNRRRAYMERLICGGDYFSEDCMREREPYLHYEYVGRFQDPFARVLCRPGEKFSEMLMRRCEEEILVKKIRDEQKRLGVERKDWVGDDDGSEEEMNFGSRSSKASEDDTDASFHPSTESPKLYLSAEEMQDQMEQFTNLMQQKFLAGKDFEHIDYSAIDNDERLDDHWMKEANLDAEEKYFDED